ncbi:MAG: cell envelope integrity protein TolA [Parvularculaceae bacterium]|nr:cell envelope integrity protein TolA [Parvularculaceae bacterium]
MRYATFVSMMLHLGVLFGGLIIAPFITTRDVLVTPVVPIQLLSEAEIADELSVRADRTADAVEDAPPEKVMPKDGIEEVSLDDPLPMPLPPEPEPEPEPQQPEPEPEIEPEPEPEPEPEEKVQPPQKKPEKIDDLAGLEDALKDLEDDPFGAPSEVLDPEGLNNQERLGLGGELTATETDLVRARMLDCYDQLSGVPDAANLVVEVKINLDRDGTIRGDPEVINNLAIQVSGNPYWKATKDRAIRAAIKCAPYDYLPQDKYDQWDELTLVFTPLGVM